METTKKSSSKNHKESKLKIKNSTHQIYKNVRKRKRKNKYMLFNAQTFIQNHHKGDRVAANYL